MEEFIKAMNTFLQEERKKAHSKCKSFFVEHKVITPHPTFKAMKTYNIFIYVVKQDKTPLCLIRNITTFNSSKKTPEEVYKEMSIDVMTQFMHLIKTFDWDKIVEGHFEERIYNGTLD